MEAIAKKKNINQGRNIRLARNWKGVTQEALAFDLSLSQKQISEIEAKETIDDALLDKIAASLQVPSDFLKTFEMENIMNSYVLNNHETYEMSQTNSENASGNDLVQQKVIENQTINYPVDDIKDLYSKLLDEKDKQIIRFENHVNELKREIEALKGKIG